MPNKPTIPLYPPQGIQAELDLLYLFSRTAMDNATKAAEEANEKADAALKGMEDFEDKVKAETDRAMQAEGALSDKIDGVEALIPSQANPSNQLADKNFVNSSIQSNSAYYRGDWATFADIPSDVEQYPADPTGNKTPTANDYLIVTADETHEGKTWRYKYTGLWETEGKNGWWAEAAMNVTTFTSDQLAALDSGATKELISQIDTNRHDISDCKGDISALEMDKADKTDLEKYVSNETFEQFAGAFDRVLTDSLNLKADKTALADTDKKVAALETDKQNKLKAGENITIDEDGTISAEGLPEQAGHSGYLTTDGANASWSDKDPLVNNSDLQNTLVIGQDASARSVQGVVIGPGAQSTGIGNRFTVIGGIAKSNSGRATVIGYAATIEAGYSVAIGSHASVTQEYGIAIGDSARSRAARAIQIGSGTNNKEKTLQISFNDYNGEGADYILLEGDGHIPDERLAKDGTEGQVLTKTADGMEWKDASGGSLPENVVINSASHLDTSVAIFGIATPAAQNAIAIGTSSQATDSQAVSIGFATSATWNSTAVGMQARALGQSSIQLGTGDNNDANTFQVFKYKVLDAEGHIPDERLPQLGDIQSALTAILGE